MPVYSREFLSESSEGLAVQATATVASAAKKIHQVQTTSTSALECLWLSARSVITQDLVTTIVIDTATATGREMNVFLGSRTSSDGSHFSEIFKGLPLSGTDTIFWGYTATISSGSLSFEGYYNLIATG